MTECAICLMGCRWNGQITPCGHRFHRTCLVRAATALCPLCRQLIGNLHIEGRGVHSQSYLPGRGRVPDHIHASFGLVISPRKATIQANGGPWIVFKRAKGERVYSNGTHGMLSGVRTGVAWGRPVAMGRTAGSSTCRGTPWRWCTRRCGQGR